MNGQKDYRCPWKNTTHTAQASSTIALSVCVLAYAAGAGASPSKYALRRNFIFSSISFESSLCAILFLSWFIAQNTCHISSFSRFRLRESARCPFVWKIRIHRIELLGMKYRGLDELIECLFDQ